jgi:hypothetical protein
MRFSWYITKATHVLTVCNTYCFSIAKITTRTRLDITLIVTLSVELNVKPGGTCSNHWAASANNTHANKIRSRTLKPMPSLQNAGILVPHGVASHSRTTKSSATSLRKPQNSHVQIAVPHVQIPVHHVQIAVHHVQIAVCHVQIAVHRVQIAVQHVQIAVNYAEIAC